MRLRNIVIAIFMLGMAIPFLLIRDIYPFYRLGMYATSYRSKGHIDKYFVIGERAGSREMLSLKPTPSLISEYVFRKQTKAFLEKLNEQQEGNKYSGYELYKISYYPQNPAEPETTLVDSWHK